MSTLRLSKVNPTLQGTIPLDGSKSISNRALIILALAGGNPAQHLTGLSKSKDTQTLLRLLGEGQDVYDAGDAGTVFRFLTAYLSLQPGTQTLTGSRRMLERPIGPLVQALQKLGAAIEYLGEEGYPPLKIGEGAMSGGHISVPATISSQFLSALLLIAPLLPKGMLLQPEGTLVSRPYLEMTLRIMNYFGAHTSWEPDGIRVLPGAYQLRDMQVEADWSAASYWYAMAGLSTEADLELIGLYKNSLQGDSVIRDLCIPLGIKTDFTPTGIRIQKGAKKEYPLFMELDFRNCPDIAQTMAALLAGLGISAQFSGLETLSIKETDRIMALQNELAKANIKFVCQNPEAPSNEQHFQLKGTMQGLQSAIATYGDHRMAMAFAPWGLLQPVHIENPDVVVKSYPQFWQHVTDIGFDLQFS
jgi:3-phosphoshikimate 1-carboxyvinyltransferase